MNQKDWDEYDEEMEEYAREKIEEDNDLGYYDEFECEDEYLKTRGDESKESSFFKDLDTKTKLLDEAGKSFGSYYLDEPVKKATLHKFESVKIRKRTEMDLRIFFGLLHKQRMEGLAYLFIKQDKRTAYIYDMFVPKQSVSSGSCDPDPKALALWMVKNKNNVKKEDLRGWAHSHGDMGCFWSVTDDDYAKSLTTGFDLTKPKMLFSLVYSFAGNKVSRLGRFDISSLFGRITIDKIDIDTVDVNK